MSKIQILVVEDDLPVRNLITTTLKAQDYRYLTAETGEGAIMETATHNPESSRRKFITLNRTSIPKFCIAKPPFQYVSENGYR